MKVPPYKPDGEAFDSICDAKPQIINISNNQIFVCYNDNQCYP